jgi:hypothetical protein
MSNKPRSAKDVKTAADVELSNIIMTCEKLQEEYDGCSTPTELMRLLKENKNESVVIPTFSHSTVIPVVVDAAQAVYILKSYGFSDEVAEATRKWINSMVRSFKLNNYLIELSKDSIVENMHKEMPITVYSKVDKSNYEPLEVPQENFYLVELFAEFTLEKEGSGKLINTVNLYGVVVK